MATRLLSFLSDIENALTKESAANMLPPWATTRMVNYHHGLARMTLTPPDDRRADAGEPADESMEPMRSGSILLQSFLLADGSVCLKAILAWEAGTPQHTVAVYSKPQLKWKSEAAQIASLWLAGPTTTTAVSAEPTSVQPDLQQLLAQAN